MPSDVVVGLAPWLDTFELRELMLPLIGWRGESERDREAVEEVIERYKREMNFFPYGVVCEGTLAGMIGIEAKNKHGIIHHIVVAAFWRHCGIGRQMIDEAAVFLGLSVLEAETDADAVNFYRACGFVIRSLGEKYPGTERFLCRLHLTAVASTENNAEP
jgi:ribosomal protein S18 acetylase RimI-like enzyme